MGVRGQRRVGSVVLDDGATVSCDHVVLGVGVEPDLGWLSTSSLDSSGVPTDMEGRTGVEGIYAAGDAAAAFDPVLERHVIGSHWESAGRQGARAAKAMLGLDQGPAGVSSFWSDLHGTRVHYLGHASLADDLRLDGDPSSCDFSAIFTRQDRVVAMLLVGRPQMLPQARQLLATTTEMALA
jgi:3-phenylpropionate/trans-cinnamate dioxygenase ferredoxin reductase subunit